MKRLTLPLLVAACSGVAGADAMFADGICLDGCTYVEIDGARYAPDRASLDRLRATVGGCFVKPRAVRIQYELSGTTERYACGFSTGVEAPEIIVHSVTHR